MHYITGATIQSELGFGSADPLWQIALGTLACRTEHQKQLKTLNKIDLSE